MKTKTGFKIAKQMLFLIILVVLSGSNAQSKISGSKLVMDSLTHDFKEVSEEASVSHVFQVKNMGDKELKIDKVKTT